MQAVGFYKVGTLHAERCGFLVHQLRKRAFTAGDIFRDSLCRVVAGDEHHAVKQRAHGKFLPADDPHCGTTLFHVFAHGDHYVKVGAVFNGEDAGHDLCGACGECAFPAAFFKQNGTGGGFHQHDMRGGNAVWVKGVSQRRGGQQGERSKKSQQAGNKSFQVQQVLSGVIAPRHKTYV